MTWIEKVDIYFNRTFGPIPFRIISKVLEINQTTPSLSIWKIVAAKREKKINQIEAFVLLTYRLYVNEDQTMAIRVYKERKCSGSE